ncbi:unnamed protein product [Allacma fusca]|uniref:Secreted protein n=1 Tax=Allacma fusca TaxID=39272 RepID=A0A8J2J304_9HEXA|nr:unnamed protein product [Allacma fusca]
MKFLVLVTFLVVLVAVCSGKAVGQLPSMPMNGTQVNVGSVQAAVMTDVGHGGAGSPVAIQEFKKKGGKGGKGKGRRSTTPSSE